MEPNFLNWMAGFIDGEGSFTIESWKPGKPKTCFRLEIRDDDRAILDEIISKTGVGYLRERPRRGNRNPTVVWEVRSLEHCIALRDILASHPLRAKKRRDFYVWSLAVTARQKGDREALRALSNRLKQVRAYSGSVTT